MEENSGFSGKVTVTGPSAARLGYEFGRMADASGKLQPYLYGKIYSNGSAEPKSVGDANRKQRVRMATQLLGTQWRGEAGSAFAAREFSVPVGLANYLSGDASVTRWFG